MIARMNNREPRSHITEHVHLDDTYILEIGESAGTGLCTKPLSYHFRASQWLDTVHACFNIILLDKDGDLHSLFIFVCRTISDEEDRSLRKEETQVGAESISRLVYI